ASLDGDVLSVTGTGEVRGVDVDLHAAGELAPTIAALAALADSPSRRRGNAHLCGNETDRLAAPATQITPLGGKAGETRGGHATHRLAALATEITRLGGQAEETRDGLVITPRPLHGALFRTYHDHRMATSAAVIGLRVPGVGVENVETTAKTLPGFAGMWERMLGGSGAATR